MAIDAVDWAMRQRVTPPASKLVLIALANRANGPHWECFPSIPTIAADATVHRASVIRHLDQLEESGFIHRRRTGRATVYRLRPMSHSATSDVAECDITQSDIRGRRKRHQKSQIAMSEVAYCDPNRNRTVIEPEIEPGGTQNARKTRAPATLAITTEMRAWADGEGITADLDSETRAMLDHYRGNGEVREDWRAVWNSWMRRAKRFGNSNGRRQDGGTESSEYRTRRREILDRLKSTMSRTNISEDARTLEYIPKIEETGGSA